jgi:hypothetical protein
MVLNEEIRQATWRIENILNQIPSYYYVPKDYLNDCSNDYATFLTSIGLIPKKKVQGERKKNIKYHPAYWYATSFVSQQTPLRKGILINRYVLTIFSRALLLLFK